MPEEPKHESESNPQKKISLKDAIRNQLAAKKQTQFNEKQNPALRSGNMTAKSQMTKKVNNQRRRTGGS